LIVTTVLVRAGSRSYQAYVGPKLLEQIGEIVKEHLPLGRCAIISDANVAQLFGERVKQVLTSAGFEPMLVTIPPGEKSKSLPQAGEICDRMTAAGLDGSSFVVALGGGVVGDLAGFVAAIYHRGIPYVQVPTTLLAQVDSSIGGKTAVNTIAGKNLIGAMHQPALVISDTDILATLPPRELNQGFAEMIKHAIIRDAGLFAVLENFDRQMGDFESLVRRNVEIKAEFVGLDERDTTGRRALLNFGHTVGHAIERAGDYHKLLHGEAVSLGIVAACGISVRTAGLAESQQRKIVALLERYDLPTRLRASISREKILRALPFDKKFERGQVRFVVTPGIGTACLTNDVSMDDIREAVSRL
jgi:3-dehydroquinate synthase